LSYLRAYHLQGSNWQGGSAPGTNDAAVINSGNDDIVISSNINIQRLIVSTNFSGSITQQGTSSITIGSNGMNFNGGSFVGGSGTIDINGQATIGAAGSATWTSTSGEMDISGTLTLGSNATFNHNNGTVDMSGTSSISVQNPSSNDFNNLNLAANSRTTTLSTDIQAANLTLGGGTLANSSNDITVRGNGTIFTDGGASITGSGDFYFIADGAAAIIDGFTSTSDTDVFIRSNGDQQVTLGAALSLPTTATIQVYGLSSGTTTTFSSGGYSITGGPLYAGANGTTQHGNISLGASTVSSTIVRNYTSGSTLNLGSSTLSMSSSFIGNTGTVTAGTSTLTFTGTSASLSTGGASVYNVTYSGGGNYYLSQDTDINGSLNISNGTLNLSSGNRTVNLAGAVSVGVSGSITFGTGDVIFDGTTSLTDSAGLTWQNVQTSGTAAVTQASSFDTDEITISSGTTWTTAGNTFEVDSTFSNDGTFIVQGNETLTISPGNDTDSGTVQYTGRNVSETLTITDLGSPDYYHLVINDTNSNKATFNLGSTIGLTGNLTVTSGTLAGNGNTMNVTGNVVINGGTFNSPTTLTVAGDWTYSSGTFSAADDTTVRFTGSPTITGANSFHHLSKTSGAGTITIPASTTQTIAGDLTITGTSSSNITLVSSSSGTAATMDVSGTATLQNLIVQDISMTNATDCLTGCTDSGNNTNIAFTAATSTPTSPFAISCPALPNPKLILNSVERNNNRLIANFTPDHGRAGTAIIVSTDPFFRNASWMRLANNPTVDVKLRRFNGSGTVYFIVRNLCYTSGVRTLTLTEENGVIVSDSGETIALEEEATETETTEETTETTDTTTDETTSTDEAINDETTETDETSSGTDIIESDTDEVIDETTDDETAEEVEEVTDDAVDETVSDDTSADETTDVTTDTSTDEGTTEVTETIVQETEEGEVLESVELVAGMLLQSPQSPNVYYYSAQGLRHEFRSEDIFFNWYEDFSGITRIPDAQLNSIAFGRPVTASPGESLVRFAGSDRVYAVGFGGVLRWILSPNAAATLFGSKWPEIVQITNNIFFGDYLIGEPILETGDFDPDAESAPSLDADLQRSKDE
jgi:hypothetical protein